MVFVAVPEEEEKSVIIELETELEKLDTLVNLSASTTSVRNLCKLVPNLLDSVNNLKETVALLEDGAEDQ